VRRHAEALHKRRPKHGGIHSMRGLTATNTPGVGAPPSLFAPSRSICNILGTATRIWNPGFPPKKPAAPDKFEAGPPPNPDVGACGFYYKHRLDQGSSLVRTRPQIWFRPGGGIPACKSRWGETFTEKNKQRRPGTGELKGKKRLWHTHGHRICAGAGIASIHKGIAIRSDSHF